MSELVVLNAEGPGDGVVEALTEALELAKEGKLSSVAVAWVRRSGHVNGTWSRAPNSPLLLGAIGRLAHRINLAMDE